MNNNKDTYFLKIRPLSISDYETVIEWSRHENFCLANQWELNREPDEVYSWWHKCVNNTANNFIRMGIDIEGNLIGYTDLANITNNSAELGICEQLKGKQTSRIPHFEVLEYRSYGYV